MQTEIRSAIRYWLVNPQALTIVAAVCPRVRRYLKSKLVIEVTESEMQDPCLRQALPSPYAKTKIVLCSLASSKDMSRASKLTLAGTSLSAIGIVVLVHYQQRAEKAVSLSFYDTLSRAIFSSINGLHSTGNACRGDTGH